MTEQLTVQISFEDSDGQWRDFLSVPADALQTTQSVADETVFEYRIDRSAAAPSALPEPIEFVGTRCWEFKWFDAGQPTGLFVRRRMKFDAGDHDQLMLHTA